MLNISIQETPNPQVLKFIIPNKITDHYFEFEEARSAQSTSALAFKLLSFPWVKKVFIGENFISITKEDWADWELLKSPLVQLIQATSKEDILSSQKTHPMDSKNVDQNDDEIVKKIKDILKKEIQPAVQMDGGFIQFESYKDGKVYVKLQGACSGCPSAEWTLKQGIEDRFKREIPQILEVISI